MLIDGLGGQYLMISGGSLYVKTPNMDSFYAMPPGLRWNGTIIANRYDAFLDDVREKVYTRDIF